MQFYKCDKCLEYHWKDDNCPDIFHVQHKELMSEEDYVIIRASDEEDAAKKYAIDFNEHGGEYSMVQNDGNDTIHVSVFSKDFSTVKHYTVKAKTIIEYTVTNNQ